MKWLLATMALALSMSVAQAGFADDAVPSTTDDQAQSDAVPSAVDEDAAAAVPSNMESTAPASGSNATEPASDSADDVLDLAGGRAIPAAGANSVSDIIGADVVGPTGDTVGTVDDLVLGMDDRVEQMIIADGGLFGVAGNSVAIDFAGSELTTDEGDDAKMRISMTDEALDQAAEFDESQLEGQGKRLASSYLDQQVRLSASEEEGEIEDLLIGPAGTLRYAIIAFHGMFDAEDDLVAVEMDQIVAANPDAPITVSMSAAQIRSAPKYGEPPAAAATAQ